MNTRGETNNGANRCERWPGHTAWQLHRAAYRKARRLSCKIRTRPVMRITLAARPALGALAPREDTGASSRHGNDAPRRARARAALSAEATAPGDTSAPSGPKARRPYIVLGKRSNVQGGDGSSSPHRGAQGPRARAAARAASTLAKRPTERRRPASHLGGLAAQILTGSPQGRPRGHTQRQ